MTDMTTLTILFRTMLSDGLWAELLIDSGDVEDLPEAYARHERAHNIFGGILKALHTTPETTAKALWRDYAPAYRPFPSWIYKVTAQ